MLPAVTAGGLRTAGGAGLREEVTELLQRLIRVDTTNPPGNETAAAELLRDYLEASGVECELYARIPERANLVARLRGRADGPRLLLLCHTDVVVADPAEWQVPPFAGELRDGQVWGRGALDMKGQVAANAVALASLAREGFEPEGELILAATADEEVGDHYGLSWLCEEHPDAVRCDYAINEGGGDRMELGGKVFYLCSAAEKMSSPFVLHVHGRSGHASLPGIADNALVKAARLVDRLAGLQPERQVGPELAAFLQALLGEVPSADEAVERAAAVDPAARYLVEPLTAMTLSPTMVTASRQRNVIPALCDVTVDCRLVPGQAQNEAAAAIRRALGDDTAWELEWIEAQGGTRSPIDTPLWDAVASFVADLEPGARAVPFCTAGFTDSHWLREAFGTVAYGFFPLYAMSSEQAALLAHSADERVPVDDLELGVSFLRSVVRRVLGGR
jgi:acetylornithine deacetylase/succinyl-diaminopimelate desuccinylase-like protein